MSLLEKTRFVLFPKYPFNLSSFLQLHYEYVNLHLSLITMENSKLVFLPFLSILTPFNPFPSQHPE